MKGGVLVEGPNLMAVLVRRQLWCRLTCMLPGCTPMACVCWEQLGGTQNTQCSPGLQQVLHNLSSCTNLLMHMQAPDAHASPRVDIMWCVCLFVPAQVRLSPSDVLSGALAVSLATAELVTHHTSFTLNNMVRDSTQAYQQQGQHARHYQQQKQQQLRGVCVCRCGVCSSTRHKWHGSAWSSCDSAPSKLTRCSSHTPNLNAPPPSRLCVCSGGVLQVACLVATEILALVGLRSFRTAALLLVGLLAYDVFWVFGSPQGREGKEARGRGEGGLGCMCLGSGGGGGSGGGPANDR